MRPIISLCASFRRLRRSRRKLSGRLLAFCVWDYLVSFSQIAKITSDGRFFPRQLLLELCSPANCYRVASSAVA